MMKGAAAAGVGVVIALTIACDRSATAPSPAPAGSTGIVGLAIRGPERLAPGETARFTAMATVSDGSTQDYTQKVTWNSTPQDVLTIARTTGEATARTSGDAIVWADAANHCCPGVRMAVLVLPREHLPADREGARVGPCPPGGDGHRHVGDRQRPVHNDGLQRPVPPVWRRRRVENPSAARPATSTWSKTSRPSRTTSSIFRRRARSRECRRCRARIF